MLPGLPQCSAAKVRRKFAKQVDPRLGKLEQAILYIQRNPEMAKSITSLPYIRKPL
jgi:hypothetical protein